jgi:putative SOS response-associated peptidase YedK
MCGRYTLAPEAEELVDAFGVPGLTFDYAPRYNIAPGQQAPVIAEDARGRRMGLLTWGLAPNWMDDPGSGFINARAESVHEKASFREAFEHRRCLVPADGFYEWKREGGAKIPHWLHPAEGGLVSFAGIWERWARPGAEPRHTFAILTTEANAEARVIHDRTPVVVEESEREVWLARSSDLDAVRPLLRPPRDGTFASHRVSTRVNDPGLVEPVRLV